LPSEPNPGADGFPGDPGTRLLTVNGKPVVNAPRRAICLTLLSACLLSALSPAARAQDQVVDLVSYGGYTSQRLADDVTQVDLQEQTHGRCRFNRSWGYDLSNRELWADAGCGGRFRLTRSERAENRGSNTAAAVAALAAIAGIALLANHNRHDPVQPNPPPNADGGMIRGLGGLCLDSDGGEVRPGARLQIYGCHGRSNQRFSWGRSGELMVDNLCLDIEGANRNDGARVIAWSCSGAANQLWRANGNQIVSRFNGKCLDVFDGKAKNGQPVGVWACNGGQNQRWWW
jgi:hypothetical protein